MVDSSEQPDMDCGPGDKLAQRTCSSSVPAFILL